LDFRWCLLARPADFASLFVYKWFSYAAPALSPPTTSAIKVSNFLFSSPSPAVLVDGFEVGREQTFSLINDVTLYDLKTADQPIGYRISGAVKVGAIWGNAESGFLLAFEVWKSF
jgi:hypothetical protein